MTHKTLPNQTMTVKQRCVSQSHADTLGSNRRLFSNEDRRRWKPVQTAGVPERNQIRRRKERNVTSLAGVHACMRACAFVFVRASTGVLHCECQCCSRREMKVKKRGRKSVGVCVCVSQHASTHTNTKIALQVPALNRFYLTSVS